LNTGGALLHPQEIRACIYHGPLNELLSVLNKDSAWRAVYGSESQRMKDRELILRFFALMFDLDTYSKPMEGALNSYMAKNRMCQVQTEEQLRRVFLPTIEHISNALGTGAFRPVRAINAAVFDSVMVGLARRLAANPNIDLDRLRTSYNDLLGSTEYKTAYEGSTSDEEKVRTRIRIASEHFATTI
jgi:hypothetical protein